MYDVEGKYRQLMKIAKGEVPKMNRYDSKRKYTCFASQVHAAKAILMRCRDDEKKMILWRILKEQEAVKNGKSVISVAAFCMSGMSLLMVAINALFDVSHDFVSPISNRTNAIYAVAAFILAITLVCIRHNCYLNRRSGQLKFLLNLWND